MAFYVSRQRDNADNKLYVEIACGGSKKAGTDILSFRYEGEGKNLVSPKDAVNVAERIHTKWDHDYPDERKSLRITGLSSPNEILHFDFTTTDIVKANAWADKLLNDMDKCGACDKPMGNRTLFDTPHIPGKVFCSEVCIARKYRDMFGQEIAVPLAGHKKPKKI